MSRRFAIFGLTAAGVMVMATMNVSLAGSARDPTFQPRNWQSVGVQRYPGDQALAGGTVRTQGPEKGPYIERCYWSARTGALGILPFGLTQRCYRHTLENTPE